MVGRAEGADIHRHRVRRVRHLRARRDRLGVPSLAAAVAPAVLAQLALVGPPGE